MTRRDDWGTPQRLYDYLNAIFKFTVDACASAENHKHQRYWTEDDNALRYDWNRESVFCNPPYSRTKEFVEHAMNSYVGSLVLLIPVRSDRIWYQKAKSKFMNCDITGRLHFNDCGKGAFMYSTIWYRHVDAIKALPDWTDAGQFNVGGKGGATS